MIVSFLGSQSCDWMECFHRGWVEVGSHTWLHLTRPSASTPWLSSFSSPTPSTRPAFGLPVPSHLPSPFHLCAVRMVTRSCLRDPWWRPLPVGSSRRFLARHCRLSQRRALRRPSAIPCVLSVQTSPTSTKPPLLSPLLAFAHAVSSGL